MPTNHQAKSPDEMREVLRIYTRRFSKLAEAADQLSISPSNLSEMLSGQRSISDYVAAQLGFSKVREKKQIIVVYYVGAK